MAETESGRVLYARYEGTYVLKLIGDIRVALCGSLDTFVGKMFTDKRLNSVLIDLTDARLLDSTALGVLAKISVHMQRQFQQKPVIISTRTDITRVLNSMGFSRVFDIIDEEPVIERGLVELPRTEESVREMCTKVLEAHRVLMSLNEKNKETFKSVVATLESEQYKQSVDEGAPDPKRPDLH